MMAESTSQFVDGVAGSYEPTQGGLALMPDDKTTIWVSKSTAARLKTLGEQLADYHKPSYDEVIRRLLNYHEIHSGSGIDPELLKESGKK